MTATLNDEVAALRRVNAELQRRLDESLAREAATAEVLEVINSSPGDLAPVFDAMLDRAMHLCEAAFGTLWIYEAGSFHAAALHRVPKAYAGLSRVCRSPRDPDPCLGGLPQEAPTPRSSMQRQTKPTRVPPHAH